jgi:tetratricopeptide (TPR) repeat protein
MGLAGVLFDQGKYKEAEQGYREVRDGQIAANDPQLKGEATEGIALSLEALGQKDAAEKAFKELENLGEGFAKLGQYHRARLLYEGGKRDAAKEILKKLLEKSDKEKAASPFGETGFVALAARQLLEAIDPAAARPAGGGISPEQLKKIQEQISKAAGIKGGAGADTKELMELVNKSLGEGPPAPAPAPVPVPNAEGTPKPSAPPTPAPTPAPKKPAPTAPKPVAPAPVAPTPAPAPAPAAPTPPAPGTP